MNNKHIIFLGVFALVFLTIGLNAMEIEKEYHYKFSNPIAERLYEEYSGSVDAMNEIRKRADGYLDAYKTDPSSLNDAANELRRFANYLHSAKEALIKLSLSQVSKDDSNFLTTETLRARKELNALEHELEEKSFDVEQKALSLVDVSNNVFYKLHGTSAVLENKKIEKNVKEGLKYISQLEWPKK
ncbi:MAG TPA: hypothetical protein VHO47_01500 [Candidatus Babeliales bacterium]|nr:hypothetical protein [Candidatus Babeliales bacterium]